MQMHVPQYNTCSGGARKIVLPGHNRGTIIFNGALGHVPLSALCRRWSNCRGTAGAQAFTAGARAPAGPTLASQFFCLSPE